MQLQIKATALCFVFRGDAPMLRHIETEFRKINFGTSWSHNLISVKLDKSYDIEDCLSVLLETPNLQRLEITGSPKAFSLLSYASSSSSQNGVSQTSSQLR